jgi:translation initiation factor IF-2
LTDKLRVYEVAKDLNISSEALIGILRGLGVSAKSHMSTLDHEVVDQVRQKFREEKEATKAEDARKHEVKAAMDRGVRRPAVPAGAAAPAATVAHPPAPPRKEAADVAEPAAPPAPPGAPSAPAPPKVQRRRGVVDEKSVRDSVKKTLATLGGAEKPKRYKKRLTTDPPVLSAPAASGVAVVEEHGEELRIPEMSSVAELAEILGLKPAEIITKLMGMGKMVTLNHRLDRDTIELLALEFGHNVHFVSEFGEEEIDASEEEDHPEDMKPRAPVVTVMGHVDHGKTSLLDYIRKANVVAGEKGGITQHIGAYEVRLPNGREVTFLDTPGHEAFTAMRARGAQITDIVVLVVAADDRVMPQTIEALDHARAAEVPVIVAINKIDKPEANVLMVKQDLASHGTLIEEYGGKTPSVPISAKKGTGIEELLEIILLQSDILELRANVNKPARGVVVESKIEQGRGRVATVLIQRGTLSVGDPFLCGKVFGKVRSLANERGKRVKNAGPSVPVEVTGFSDSPAAGDIFQVMALEAKARQLSQQRQLVAREIEQRERTQVSLSDFFGMKERGEVRELRLVLKADVGGSVEVLREQLGNLGTEEVGCRVIHSGVGPVNESDVLLADASNAVIIGFGVSVAPKAQEQARRGQVDIRTYNIIYEAVEDVKSALSGLLKPEEVEKVKGRVEVRQVFRTSKSGAIAGSYVLEGTASRTHQVRLLREGEVIYTGKIGSLRRFKDDVKEVAQGFECGIGLERHDDVREGDIIETFVIELVARRI